ncbi:ASKHA domain-containing protein [Candidatus Puniceispirillum marinum]|uniref:Probable electron transfer protein n=1 Tax=Puniceispirillum marinum (strain IMCC1322) TaxID=488538 RepID=D5BSS6_PUNMI|nr:ASKHA domain-containing protein [Candidatus Puniceispirillum marinum]ADE39323.1 probable electron transfer protein [Candidatus Puniceispirillum marinum IMCC1322]
MSTDPTVADVPDANLNGKTDIKVVFTPSGRQAKVAQGTTVLQAARELGVDIDSVCGGRAMCGRCQINVGTGEFAKHGIVSGAGSLGAVTAVETRYADKRGLADGRRLSCQSVLLADAVIDVPPESQVHNQLVRKAADERQIEMDPVVRLCLVEVREPDMHEPSGDFRRLAEALAKQWPDRVSGEITCDLHILQQLQPVLREGKWHVTVALRDGCHITGIWPGLKENVVGVAIDVGSTTMSAHLCDMATGAVLASTGAMNPQIRFGEDLMSRVSYGIMNPDGPAEMTKAVIAGLQQLIDGAAEQAGMSSDDVIEIVLVGNPVMHHLLLGIDPLELGGAPFALAVDSALSLKASDLGLALNQGARAYILPCIAGHVGADAAGVVLAEAPQKTDKMTLLIDVGTNAEIVVGNRDRLLAASSPTGPAFEGAQISSGQRAAPGAIERVRIDPVTLEPRFCVIGVDQWSDEDGFDEAVKSTGITGICGSGIIEILGEMYLSGIITMDGVIDGGKALISPRIEADDRTFRYRVSDNVTVTQNDVRAIQLAKAALYAGFRLLMDKININHIDKVVLAGAFGTHIDPKYAMVLGMIPDCELENVRAAGNSAGAGARMALLNKGARAEIEQTVRNIEKIETAIEPSFQDHFVKAMAIPHKSDPYAKLSAMVPLPERILTAQDAPALEGGRRRGGRRRSS